MKMSTGSAAPLELEMSAALTKEELNETPFMRY